MSSVLAPDETAALNFWFDYAIENGDADMASARRKVMAADVTYPWHERAMQAGATMREVAKEIRWVIREHERDNNMNAWLAELADRLDSPTEGENDAV